MKTMRTLCAVLLLIPVLSGCEKFSDKRFSTTIPVTFTVTKDDSAPVVVDLDSTISALVNEKLNEHKDAIKKYELVSITYKIWEFNGTEAATFNGSVGFGNVNMIAPGVNYSFDDISLHAGHNNPDQITLVFNSIEIDKIQQYFLDTNGLRIWLDGNVSEVPVTFKIAFTVNIDAIANTKD